MQKKKTGWFKTLLAKYDALCKELDVENGACRSCVPVVKFDPESEQEKKVKKETPPSSSTSSRNV